MARTEEASLVERHVEKAVLAATAVLLVLALLFKVVSSPRKIELNGFTGAGRLRMPVEKFPPEEVDQQLLRRGAALEDLLEKSPILAQEPPDYPGLLEGQFQTPYDPYRVQGFVQLVSGRKTSEVKGPAPTERKRPGLRDLTPLPRPEAPIVKIAHEVVRIAQAGGGGYDYKETVAGHGAAVFPHGELLKKWREALEKSGIPPIFVVSATEVQRRRRLPGGAWSAPETISIVRRRPNPLPPLPGKFDGKDLDGLRKAIAALAQNQKWILEPEYYDIYGPDRKWVSWMIHKPRTRVSDLQGIPAGTPAAPTTPARPATPTTPATPRAPGQLPRAPRQLPYGPGGAGGYTGGPDPRRRYPDVLPARRPAPTPPAGPGAPQVTAQVLPLQRQLDDPKGILEVWFHEMDLAVSTEYAYRVRLVVINPLVGEAQDVAKPADAEVVMLTTPWSDWSGPASVKRPTRFFVVGGSEQQGIVVVRAFAKKWGQTVSTRFTILRGQPINASAAADVLLPSGETKRTAVEFQTGALAVDFNFQRKQRLANTEHVRSTTELLYLDADGELRTRTEASDRASKQYKDLDEEVKTAASGGRRRR